MTELENFQSICDIATKTMNLEKGALSLKSRKRKIQVARQAAAYIARVEKGIHRTKIADVLNRDRTLIYYYEHSHKPTYRSCPIYRRAFEKIYKAYLDVEEQKELFINGRLMKKYLLENSVNEKEFGDVKIQVKSGDAICIIKTDYLEFSETIKIIKFVLKNYHFNIKLI